MPLLLLWSAVGVLLLVCCTNIAGLMLAQGATRRGEIATRMALGGGRGQVIRQLLVEALLLSSLAGVLGMAIGYVGILALSAIARESLQVWQDVGFDMRVFAAASAVTFAATVLASLYPALETSRVNLRTSLAADSGRAIAGARGLTVRRMMILGQVSLGVVVLVTAGLLVRSLLFLQNQAPGLNTEHVVSATLPLQDARYQTNVKVNDLFRRVLTRIKADPAVQNAAFGLNLPYERGVNTMFSFGGKTRKDTTLTYVTPEYFQALSVPILHGRDFNDQDGAPDRPVVIVNQTFARMYGSGGQVGRSLSLVGKDSFQIVGVVADLPMKGSITGYAPVTPIPTVFMPARQMADASFQMLHSWFTPGCIVRSAAPAAQTEATMRRAMLSIDPLLPFAAFRSIGAIRDSTLARQRSQAMLMSVLAGLALLLTSVGIYGLIAQLATQRYREFGIRLALGATSAQMFGAAVRPGFVLGGAGALIGFAGAYGLARVLRSLLWGVGPADTMTFAAAAALILLVAAIASVLPALKVLRLNAAAVLRSE